MKVVAVKELVNIYQDPNRETIIGRLSGLEFSFVFGQGPKGNLKLLNECYLVGADPTGDAILGYVYQKDVREWRSRKALNVNDNDKGGPLWAFANQKNINNYLVDPQRYVALARSKGRGRSLESPAMLLPVLEETYHEGISGNVYEVAYIHASSEPEKKKSPRFEVKPNADELKDNVSARSKTNIVFVVDTTASMASSLPNVKTFIEQISYQLAAECEAASLHLGLVAYRDWHLKDSQAYMPGGSFLYQVISPFTDDLGNFVKAAKSLSVTQHKSDETPEAVFDAVSFTLNKFDFKGDTNLIVLMGDAPGHQLGDLKNPQDLGEMAITGIARDKGVQIAAVQLANVTNRRDEITRQSVQFRALANHTVRCGQPLFRVFEQGELTNPTERAKFIVALSNCLSELRYIDELGRSNHISKRPILKLFRSDGGFDLSGTVYTGWVSQRSRSEQSWRPAVREFYLVTYQELRVMHNMLSAAIRMLRAKDDSKVWEQVTLIHPRLHPTQRWGEYLSQEYALPISHGIFMELSRPELMTQNQRQVERWLVKLEHRAAFIQGLLDGNESFYPFRIGGRERFCFVSGDIFQ